MEFGLLGRTLGHSYSPQIHHLLGGYDYTLYEKEPQEIADFLKHGPLTGMNVTIPYKKAVIPYLNQLTPIARKLGAVNTILRNPDGSLTGHNTDYYGFRFMVSKSGLEPGGKKCLVLGSGGASATVTAVLEQMGARVTVISRSGRDHYQNLHLHRDAAIVVNTTPLGMYPETGSSPVDLKQFPCLEGVLDLIYNPARTRLMMDAEELGIRCLGGLWMLVAQAKEAAEWFLGYPIPDARISEVYRSIRSSTENIVLIGMPGCGKSTTARLLLSCFPQRGIVEIDNEIEKAAGMTIPDIFAREGEEAFRELETGILAQYGSASGLILSTGGGCVTRLQNYRHLHCNGRIFWLQREISSLSTEGRPLSQAGSLEQMYRIREPMYRRFADNIVPSGDIAAIKRIMGGLE